MVFLGRYKPTQFLGFFHITDSVVESVGFIFAVICMTLSEVRWIKYFGTGYLLIVASDFIIRTSFVADNIILANPLETLWILGLVFQVLGLSFLNKEGRNNTAWKFKKINQLQPTVSIVLFLVSFFSFALFLVMEYILSGSSSVLVRKNGDVFVSTVIFMSILSILISIKLSESFFRNLKGLEDLVSDKIINKKNVINNSGWFGLFELNELKKLVFEAFKLKNEALLKEKELSIKAVQVAHDIRSPLAAFELSIKNSHFQEQSEIVNISKRINEIANDLLDCFVNTTGNFKAI